MTYTADDKIAVSNVVIALINSGMIRLDYEGDGDIRLRCNSVAEDNIAATVFHTKGFSWSCAVDNALRTLSDSGIVGHTLMRLKAGLHYEGANELVFKLDQAVRQLAIEEVINHEIFSRPELFTLIKDNCELEFARAKRVYDAANSEDQEPWDIEKPLDVPASNWGIL